MNNKQKAAINALAKGMVTRGRKDLADACSNIAKGVEVEQNLNILSQEKEIPVYQRVIVQIEKCS